MSKNKTMIEGGEYHLLDLQESINGLVDEFHRRIPVDNDEDLQDLWNITIKCCKKYIEVNKPRKENIMIPKGWTKEDWEKLKKDYPNNYMKVYEVKDRINAYVDETWRCWIDQEASMKKNGLQSMFEQILEDGKQLAKTERKEKRDGKM